jgi:hypothetical protein
MCGLIRGSAGWRPRSMPQTSHRNRAKALRSLRAPRLGPLLQLCKMATARLSVQLDKSRGQRQYETPRSLISRTASSLNSRVNCRLSMTHLLFHKTPNSVSSEPGAAHGDVRELKE